jgi:hypothetical protein
VLNSLKTFFSIRTIVFTVLFSYAFALSWVLPLDFASKGAGCFLMAGVYAIPVGLIVAGICGGGRTQ